MKHLLDFNEPVCVEGFMPQMTYCMLCVVYIFCIAVCDLSEGTTDGCRYVGRKDETGMKSKWQVKKSEWKNTEIWKAKGKAMDTNTGCYQEYQR